MTEQEVSPASGDLEQAVELIAPLIKTHPDALIRFALWAKPMSGHVFGTDSNRVEGLLVLECAGRLRAETKLQELRALVQRAINDGIWYYDCPEGTERKVGQ